MGKVFTDLAKTYLGALAQNLEKKTGINRYFYALILIKENNGALTQQKLSEFLGADKVITVRIIDYLSKKGLVKRQVNNKDRREHFLILTPKAEKCIPEIRKAYQDLESSALEGLSNKQKKEFIGCLEIVSANLSKLPSTKVNFKLIQSNKKV